MRVVATFLRPNSAKELSLDAIIRDTAIRELAHNTHPDVVCTYHDSPLFVFLSYPSLVPSHISGGLPYAGKCEPTSVSGTQQRQHQPTKADFLVCPAHKLS